MYIYSTCKAVKDEETALGGETAVFNLELCKKSDLRIKINLKKYTFEIGSELYILKKSFEVQIVFGSNIGKYTYISSKDKKGSIQLNETRNPPGSKTG